MGLERWPSGYVFAVRTFNQVWILTPMKKFRQGPVCETPVLCVGVLGEEDYRACWLLA